MGRGAVQGESFGAALAIPPAPALDGVQVVLQATVAPSDSAVGFDLTEGLLVTFGR